MNWQNVTFDWNQVRAFLVTAEAGSLSAAARELGLTQPTLGRQVAALERSLDVTLFDRTGRRMVLTEAGERLIGHVRSMGEAAARVALVASGAARSVEGPVSITASDVICAHLLPPALARLRAEAPGITVDLVADNEIRDLRRREADIALRHVRPSEPDLYTRRLRDGRAHLYAASAYLDQFGRPQTAADLASVAFVGFDRGHRLASELARRGVPVGRDGFRLFSASGVVAWSLVRAGLGIGVMMAEVARLAPEVEPVLPDLLSIPVPVWLTTHREVQTSRRIRLVFDLLAETFA